MSTQRTTPFPLDEYLTPDEIAASHARLHAMLDELLTQGQGAVAQLTREEEGTPDPLDLAASAHDREQVMRQADRERRLIIKVRESLQRIAEGDYGSCDGCGGPISYGRLLARPVATLCIDCKSEAERQEGPPSRPTGEV
jgi:DnaK suppressor protein